MSLSDLYQYYTGCRQKLGRFSEKFSISNIKIFSKFISKSWFPSLIFFQQKKSKIRKIPPICNNEKVCNL